MPSGGDSVAQKAKKSEKSAERVTVLLPKADSLRFAAYCEERGFKKSTLIVRLIRDHLDRERFQSQAELFGAKN